MKILTVYDHKAGAFMQPFYDKTVAAGERRFAECCHDPEHLFCKHPEDFTLFLLGEFYEDSGRIDVLPTPEPVAKAVKYEQKKLFPLFDREGRKGEVA